MTTEHHFRSGFIAIVGRPNVGKSTLLNSLVGQKISITSGKAQTTRYRINGILTDQTSQFIFVDTPGFQNQYLNQLGKVMNRAVTQSMADVDVILFVIEAMRFDERDRLVLGLLPAGKPVVLVINKIDRMTDKSLLLPFLEKMSGEFAFAAVVPVSAEAGTSLPGLIAELRTWLPEGPRFYGEDEITDRSERFIAAELVREKLFRLLGDEIPYATSVMVEKFELDGQLRRIHVSIVVDRPGQKAIIIGKNGEKLKLVATQARKDMERAFGGKVYLETWVKIKNGWTDDVKVLKTLGYE
jgi:GTPase